METSGNQWLAEYDQLNQLWRHADSRLNNGLSIFLTSNAIVVSALGVVLAQTTNTPIEYRRLLFGPAIALALGVFASGLIYVQVIVKNQVSKEKYLAGLSHIRSYIQTFDITLPTYLVHPTVLCTKLTPSEKTQGGPTTKAKLPWPLLVAVSVWGSAMLGVAGGLFAWMLQTEWLNKIPTDLSQWCNPGNIASGLRVAVGLVGIALQCTYASRQNLLEYKKPPEE